MIMLGSENQEAREIKVKRENVYYITTFVVFSALCLITLGLSQFFTGDRWSFLQKNIVFLFLFWRIGNSLATKVCQRFGLSLDGKKIEKIGRIDKAIKRIYIERPLIMGNQSVKFFLAVLMTLGCAIFGSCLFANHKTFDSLQIAAFIVLIFSVLCVVSFFSWLNVRKPLVRIDNQGVAHCDVLGLQNNLAKWDEIESCDVVHIYDVFGHERQNYIMINQVNGKKFKIHIGYASEVERIAHFIKSVVSDDRMSPSYKS